MQTLCFYLCHLMRRFQKCLNFSLRPSILEIIQFEVTVLTRHAIEFGSNSIEIERKNGENGRKRSKKIEKCLFDRIRSKTSEKIYRNVFARFRFLSIKLDPIRSNSIQFDPIVSLVFARFRSFSLDFARKNWP